MGVRVNLRFNCSCSESKGQSDGGGSSDDGGSTGEHNVGHDSLDGSGGIGGGVRVLLVIAQSTVGVEILGVRLVSGESVLSLTVLVIVGLIRRQKKEGLEFVGGEDTLVELFVLNETEVTADGDDSVETHGGRVESGGGDPGPDAGPVVLG